MNSVTLPAFAKVNLHLEVLGKRPDGYHELVTLFERVSLADEVTVERAPGEEISLESDSAEIPPDAGNLAVRAALEFREASGRKEGIRIRLTKRIPVGGGLGGGSSDAAAVLLAMQKLSGGLLSKDQLQACAAQLGSDVAFFVTEQTRAIGRGRGERLEPVRSQASLWHLLVTPDFPIATRSVYEAFHRDSSKASDVSLLLQALQAQASKEIRRRLFNALEPTVQSLHPAIGQVKETIQTAGLDRPMVSGSGSTVFALCDSSEQAQKAAEHIRRQHPSWRVAAASTA